MPSGSSSSEESDEESTLDGSSVLLSSLDLASKQQPMSSMTRMGAAQGASAGGETRRRGGVMQGHKGVARGIGEWGLC